MNIIQRIAKNTTVLIFSEIISKFLGLLYITSTIRYLGVEQFGILSFALSFTVIFTIIATLGLNQLLVREVSRDKSLIEKYVGNILIIRLIFSLFTFGIITIIMLSFNFSPIKISIVLIITIALFFSYFTDVLNSIIRVYEIMEYISLEKILISLLMFILALIAINQNLTVIAFAYIYFIVNMAAFLYVLIIYVKKVEKIKFQVDLKLWKEMIIKSLPFFLTIIIARMLIFNMDIILLSELKGDEFAGLYNAAVAIILIIITLVDLFIYAIIPIISKMFVSSQESLKKLINFSSKYLFIIALPISTCLFFLAEYIILILYGNEFSEAALALKLLSLYLPIRVISLELGWILSSINKEHLRTISSMIALIINITISIILIPFLGIVGVCISTILSQVVLFILYFYFIYKNFYHLPLKKIVLKPFICWDIMIIFLLALQWINLFLILSISMLIYILMLLLLKSIDAEEMEIFKNLIKPVFQLLQKNLKKNENG